MNYWTVFLDVASWIALAGSAIGIICIFIKLTDVPFDGSWKYLSGFQRAMSVAVLIGLVVIVIFAITTVAYRSMGGAW